MARGYEVCPRGLGLAACPPQIANGPKWPAYATGSALKPIGRANDPPYTT